MKNLDENYNSSKERLLEELKENINKFHESDFNYWQQTNLDRLRV